jgi:hypothetical protein
MKGNIGAMQFEHDLITFLFQAAAKKRVDDCQVDAARLRWLGSRCLIADGVDFHIVAARFQAKVLQCQVAAIQVVPPTLVTPMRLPRISLLSLTSGRATRS